MKPETRDSPSKKSALFFGAVVLLVLGTSALMPGKEREAKASKEEGEFRILVGEKEIGTEKFAIVNSGDSSSSSSVLDFHTPDQARQKMHFESKLDMNGSYVPRNYELRTDVDGKKGTIIGTFPPNEAIFAYRPGASSTKSGFLVGNSFTILDSNIYHHFIFLARLFDLSNDKVQKFEVVIPQEGESGVLKISRQKKETIQVRNRRIEANLLQIDSGSLLIQLWVDDNHFLYKIAVKEKALEVIRNP